MFRGLNDTEHHNPLDFATDISLAFTTASACGATKKVLTGNKKDRFLVSTLKTNQTKTALHKKKRKCEDQILTEKEGSRVATTDSGHAGATEAAHAQEPPPLRCATIPVIPRRR